MIKAHYKVFSLPCCVLCGKKITTENTEKKKGDMGYISLYPAAEGHPAAQGDPPYPVSILSPIHLLSTKAILLSCFFSSCKLSGTRLPILLPLLLLRRTSDFCKKFA